jgi:hypothetical protein
MGEVINMATQAHLEGNKRYMAKLDRGVFYVQKGNLEKIKAHAKENGKSLNAYIVGLIEADMGKLSGE